MLVHALLPASRTHRRDIRDQSRHPHPAAGHGIPAQRNTSQQTQTLSRTD
jgi:hypothetical protein